jgi:hypothetical protein
MTLTERDLARLRRGAWAGLVAVALFAATLSGATASNYTEIVRAKVLVDTALTLDVTIENGGGSNLTTAAGFRLWANLTVDNPSSRPIRAWIVEFRAWVRDYELEDGVNTSRLDKAARLDVGQDGATQTLFFYPVWQITESFQSDLVLIDPGSRLTIPMTWNVNRVTQRSATEALVSIYNYATAEKGIPPDGVDWAFFARTLLYVNDVPRDYGGPQDSYLLLIPLIVRFDGIPLG